MIGKLCGDTTSLGDGGRALTGIAADGSTDERAWAPLIARAVLDRKLSCDSKGDPNAARLEIVKSLSEILLVEEKADKAARTKIRTIKRDIPEGSEEWDILQKRYYGEELKKYGIDPSK